MADRPGVPNVGALPRTLLDLARADHYAGATSRLSPNREDVMDDVAAEFANRIRDKDTQALVEFIELRKPQLLAFIERNLSTSLGRKLEAADILQEVSLSAVGSLATFDLGDRDPFSWLCQLAEHK